MDCLAKPSEDGWVCQACGIPLRSPQSRRNCYARRPDAMRRAINFTTALARHACDGFSKRSEEEIREILETHCKACPFFNGQVCTHQKCGCNVNREERFFNKLAWKSEHCPDGRWS